MPSRPPSDPRPKLELEDPYEIRRRAIWHDVRSVLAAAVTNVEFLSSSDLSPELREVVREIENEVRLAADVVEIVSANRDESRKIELDLRALLWVARRSGAPVVVDATSAPFSVRGTYRAIVRLVDTIVGAVAPGRTASLTTSEDGRTCTIEGLDADRALAFGEGTLLSGLGLVGEGRGTQLVLQRGD